MLEYFTAGTLLGLAAGFAPGPLLFLVVRESLNHGIGAGVRTAMAPLITDPPIILLCLFVLSEVAKFNYVLGGISLCGALMVGHLGWDSLRTEGVRVDLKEEVPSSLRKGIIINTLSPHPYLFWFTVGAPTVFQALRISPMAAAAFLISFYLCLVGAKITLAVVTGKSRSFIGGRVYLAIMRLLGILLLLFALLLLRDAIRFFA